MAKASCIYRLAGHLADGLVSGENMAQCGSWRLAALSARIKRGVAAAYLNGNGNGVAGSVAGLEKMSGNGPRNNVINGING